MELGIPEEFAREHYRMQGATAERERIIALLEADTYLYQEERDAVIALIKGEQK